jgi:hypothetical protein
MMSRSCLEQIRAIVDRLGDLINVLQSPPSMPAIINTTGKLDPPLGCIRMKVVDLLHALVLTGDAVVEQKIIESKALSVVMDLFFKYEWCNILHNTAKSMIDEILAGDKSNMKKCVIADCNLLARIITAHQPDENGKVNAIQNIFIPIHGFLQNLHIEGLRPLHVIVSMTAPSIFVEEMPLLTLSLLLRLALSLSHSLPLPLCFIFISPRFCHPEILNPKP